MTVDEVVGANVHDLLYRQKMRQAPLIEALGLTRFSLAKKMRGTQAWSATDVAVAADVLGVEVADLFKGLPEQRTWAPSDSNRQPTDYARRPRRLALLEAA